MAPILRKEILHLRLTQRLGALRDLLQIQGPDDEMARFENLKKFAHDFGTVLIGIESATPQTAISLTRDRDASGFKFRDTAQDELLAQFML